MPSRNEPQSKKKNCEPIKLRSHHEDKNKTLKSSQKVVTGFVAKMEWQTCDSRHSGNDSQSKTNWYSDPK